LILVFVLLFKGKNGDSPYVDKGFAVLFFFILVRVPVDKMKLFSLEKLPANGDQNALKILESDFYEFDKGR
jgi:hypothetical protein